MIDCGELKQNTVVVKTVGGIIGAASNPFQYSDSPYVDFTMLTMNLIKNNIRFIVSGSATPSPNGNYILTSLGTGEAFRYTREDSAFALTYSFTDSRYELKQLVGGSARWYKESSNDITGTFVPLDGGAEGGATVGVPNLKLHLIKHIFNGVASLNFTAADTDTLGDLLVIINNVSNDTPYIFPQAFKFKVVAETQEEIAAKITAVKTQTDNIPASPAVAGEAATAVIGLALEETAQSIKGKTDNLPAAPASAENVAAIGTQITNQLVEVDSYIDKTNSAQWQFVVCAKGNTFVEYARKNAFDENDEPVTAVTQVIAKLEAPE
jgi:hypothetical protein